MSRVQTVVRQTELEWIEGMFPNSSTKLFWNRDEEGLGAQAFLVKMGPGGSIPFHDHPGREYAYVLEGTMWAGGELLGPGDFLTAGPRQRHAVRTDEGVTFFIVLEQPIKILETENEDEKQHHESTVE